MSGSLYFPRFLHRFLIKVCWKMNTGERVVNRGGGLSSWCFIWASLPPAGICPPTHRHSIHVCSCFLPQVRQEVARIICTGLGPQQTTQHPLFLPAQRNNSKAHADQQTRLRFLWALDHPSPLTAPDLSHFKRGGDVLPDLGHP